jgi:hypothetical protein
MGLDLKKEKQEEMARDAKYEYDMCNDSDFFFDQVNSDINFEENLYEFVRYCKRFDRDPMAELGILVDTMS